MKGTFAGKENRQPLAINSDTRNRVILGRPKKSTYEKRAYENGPSFSLLKRPSNTVSLGSSNELTKSQNNAMIFSAGAGLNPSKHKVAVFKANEGHTTGSRSGIMDSSDEDIRNSMEDMVDPTHVPAREEEPPDIERVDKILSDDMELENDRANPLVQDLA